MTMTVMMDGNSNKTDRKTRTGFKHVEFTRDSMLRISNQSTHETEYFINKNDNVETETISAHSLSSGKRRLHLVTTRQWIEPWYSNVYELQLTTCQGKEPWYSNVFELQLTTY